MLDILYININVFWNVDIYVYVKLLIYIDYYIDLLTIEFIYCYYL